MNTTTQDNAREQAQAQYESICNMLDAMDVDYDRLAELDQEREDFVQDHHDLAPAAARDLWARENPAEADELAELERTADGCEDEEDARQRIMENAISVDVRSGWTSVGHELEAEEFQVLLCTGGPAVRIMGELGVHNEVRRAWLEYQDWGTPWTAYTNTSRDTLIRYASFFFG